MRELTGDLWPLHQAGAWIGITTNGDVRRDGGLVMGRGTAAQAKKRYPDLPFILGDLVRAQGNVPVVAVEYRLLTYPVKHHWHDKACPGLIAQSAYLLMDYLNAHREIAEIYLPRPGCGNGGLNWSWVQPTIRTMLDDRVIIVECGHA